MNQQSLIKARFAVQFANHSGAEFALQVELNLPGQGVTALFGHSGSGKTTLLRCMAGLQHCEDGLMQVNGIIWQNAKVNLPTHQRHLGYVFQEAGLLPHLNVLANLRYALKRSKASRAEQLQQVIAMLELAELLSQMPAQLSGGERQRVALARALLTEPELLLMDEPLASLDARRKQEILPYLLRLKSAAQVPLIYVSHDINELLHLADYVVVLEQGKVLMQGPLADVMPKLSAQDPSQDASVLLETEVTGRDEQWHLLQLSVLANPQSQLMLADHGQPLGSRLRIRLLAKDVSISLSQHADSSIVNRLAAQIRAFHPDPDPAMVLVELQLGEALLLARITRLSQSQLKLAAGVQVWAQIKSVAIVS